MHRYTVPFLYWNCVSNVKHQKALLTEWSLLAPEDPVSNLAFGNFIEQLFTVSYREKKTFKEAGNGHFTSVKVTASEVELVGISDNAPDYIEVLRMKTS